MTGFRTASIDLDAVSANVRHLSALVGTPDLLAVVKADAYGHGAVPVARAALAGGATWLGTADLDEALAVRAAGIDAPLLCWLHGPDTDFGAAIDANIDVAVSSLAQLHAVAGAARDRGVRANVQVKLDTGLSRNGVAPADVAAFVAEAATLTADISVRGIMSHLSNTSDEDDRAQIAVFRAGIAAFAAAGITPSLLHIAATGAAIALPESRFSMVRIGIGLAGLSPFGTGTSAELGLRPTMTLSATVVAVREVPAGTGVSYGFTYRADRPTRLALIPLGYADGIPRQASGRGPVSIAGKTYRVAGRIAMDQFLIDVGDDPVAVGDTAVLFGDPATGVPDARDWADAADTINYEIVTRIGARATRSYLGGDR